ncbi:MAG: HAD-IB family phosphatase [Nitrososphaeria archaeon]|nr:HAD-IB family phosphatase [Nitrososphaeria archaeon]
MMLEYKIIFFDMDGTLIKCKSSWELIHKKFNTIEEAKKSLEEYRQGRISYKEFMIRDISSWMRKKEKIHIKEIEEILSHFELVDGAKEVAKELKKIGLKIVIITAGIDILAEKVGKEVYADKVFANKLKTDNEGYLVGEGIEIVEPRKKDRVLEMVCKEENVSLNETIAVGDTVYDLNMLKKAGLGLYFGDKNEILDTRIHKIHSLYEIIDYIGG